MNYNPDGLYKITSDDVKKACVVAGDAFQDDPVMVFA